MKPAIEVKNLSKVYEITHEQRAPYHSLREDLVKGVKKPVKKLVGRMPPKEEFWALKNVSFSVQKGEVIGIIGRNGAGKSTLLKILSRVIYPTEGSATLRGRIASLLEVGTGFHPELTGRENIYFNGALLGMTKSEIEEKFDQIVDFAEVERFLDTPVKHYSSGMYTKLAFAVAANLNPEILIVDEVLSVGDAQFQKKSLGKMQEVASSGRTVIFVSHNMSSIKQLCSEVIWLEKGSVKSRGEANKVINSYLSDSIGNSSRVDLKDFKSMYGDNEVSIEMMELKSSIGKSFASSWEKPLVVSLKYRVGESNLENVSFAFGVQTSEGMPVYTIRNNDVSKVSLNLKGRSQGIATITADNLLRAGFYNIVLGISSGNKVLYYNPNAAQLEISESGVSIYPDKNTGIINCTSEWKFESK